MAKVYADRCMNETTSTGTGDITLGSAVTSYQSIAAKLSTGDTFDYAVWAVDSNGIPTGDWEAGLGTYSGSGVFVRTSVSGSSNSDSKVNFAAGTKRVALVVNAATFSLVLVPVVTSTDATATIAHVPGGGDSAARLKLVAGAFGEYSLEIVSTEFDLYRRSYNHAAVSIAYDDCDVHVFRENDGTEKMRITAGGNVRISNGGDLLISPGFGGAYSDVQIYNDSEDMWVRKLDEAIWFVCQSDMKVNFGSPASVNGSGRVRVRSLAGYAVSTWSDGDYTAVQFVYSAAQVGTIRCTSTATAYNTSSDRSLKEDLGESAADVLGGILDRIKIHDFRWLATGSPDVGVFAQELHELVPQAVTVGGWDKQEYTPWMVDYSKLVPVLVRALQQTRAQVQDQEQRIAAIEALLVI